MVNKEKNFISTVIYVHNAENRIENFLCMIMQELEYNFERSEIICVNDCSDDSSVERIKSTSESANTTSISILNMSYYHGLELAMNAGIDLAIGDFVFEFDSTVLDFDQSDIMKVYRRALQGYDIVSASPNRKSRLTSSLFYKLFNLFADISYEMRTERFRILSRRVINRISSMNKTVPYRKAVYANCGLKTDTIVYQVKEESKEKIDRKEKKYRKNLAMDSLILFTGVGYKFCIAMTNVMMLISIFTVVYSLGTYMTSNPVEGWTTTILFLSVAFLGLFGILTIITKYLQIIVKLVFERKRYSFESIEKLTK